MIEYMNGLPSEQYRLRFNFELRLRDVFLSFYQLHTYYMYIYDK